MASPAATRTSFVGACSCFLGLPMSSSPSPSSSRSLASSRPLFSRSFGFDARRVAFDQWKLPNIGFTRRFVRAMGWVSAALLVLGSTGFVPESSAAQIVSQARLPLLVPPVSGGIVDNWRPPSSPYGPGNQGVDLRAVAGEPVLAVGDGIVTFAGQVGGRLFVVIDTGAGVRITLGFLASVAVRTGQSVRSRDIVAHAKGPVHVGARLGTRYIDPRPLFAKRQVRLTR
jgi:murein DD-endopeptidase MepM/ murein hydrolase activator NlpD